MKLFRFAAIGVTLLAAVGVLAPRTHTQTLGTSQAQSMPSITLSATTNQVTMGAAAHTLVLSSTAPAAASQTLTFPDPTGADSVAYLALAQTFTNKTLTSPTLNSPTINTPIISDIAFATAQHDATSGTTGTTLTSVTGMSVTVVPGTYYFYLNVPGVTTANAGQKFAFKYTTTVVSSLEATGRGFTASGVAVQHTTSTTDQALLFDTAAGVDLSTVIEGQMVVGTGGTIAFQAAQHTSHADTESVYVGASMLFRRIS